MDARYDYKIHLREYVTGPMRSITQSSKVGRASVSGVNRSLTQTSRKSVFAGSALQKASNGAKMLGHNSRKAKTQLVQLERGLDRVGDEALRMNRKMSKASRGAGLSLGSVRGMMPGLSSAIAGVFAVERVIDFGRAVVDTLGNFQTMEAVLTNTLGNNSAAKVVLRDISNFAAVTPFQVDELTQSWIKLANDGFRPTMAQMTLLGDLAASRGKSLDQLVEAHMDAKRFEFERLKEFGVSTKVQGDKIAFTFKNQTTVVRKSSQAVDDYVLSLGKLKGVQGGMAAISATSAGQISNLGDKWTTFKLLVGETFKNEISNGIKGMGLLVDKLTESAHWAGQNREPIGRMAGRLKEAMDFTFKWGTGIGILHRQFNMLKKINPFPWMNKLVNEHFPMLGKWLSRLAPEKGLFADIIELSSGGDKNATAKRQREMADFANNQFGFQSAFKNVGGPIPQLVAAPSVYGSDGKSGGSKSLGNTKTKEDRLASVIGGGRSGVKNITINIDALNKGGITISTTNLKEGAQQVRRRLEEMLLSVANDANYAS